MPNDTTYLRYVAEIECTHRLVSKLRSGLLDSLDEHVDAVAERISAAAIRQAEAERKLL